MKFIKALGVVLSIVFVVVVSAGCGAKTENAKDTSSDTSSGSDSSSQTRTNPVEEVENASAFRSKLNFNFDMPLNDKKYSIVLDKVAQIDGKSSNMPITARASKTDSAEDISGDNTSYETSTSYSQDDVNYDISCNHDGACLSKWYKNGISYSLKADSNASEGQFDDLIKTIES
ncbi:MAG: hypothetical protein LBI63_03570 [Candidatus Ancillula sp.]|jgi:hypothetical protein|nr:hypothetical protein [Candidatus Ancillula sp.]